jgi:hypothetical protein
MRIFFSIVVLSFISQISLSQNKIEKSVSQLDTLIDFWHLQASKAKFASYFNITTDNFIFLGTAPGERWNKNQFKEFSKPFFDKGKAWDFKPKNRNWIFTQNGKTAWFDEDLTTWMNTCRGSGICVKENGKWKLAYYNLTVLIENEKMDEFIKLREN